MAQLYFLTMKNILVMLLLLSNSALAQDQDKWVVRLNEAECLLDNIDTYLLGDREPVVIFISLCPETDTSRIMRKLQKNSGLPSGPSVVIAPDGTEFDELIVYSKKELLCLKDLPIIKAVSHIRLPQNPCG